MGVGWSLCFSEQAQQPEQAFTKMLCGNGKWDPCLWNSSSRLTWSRFLGARVPWMERRDGRSLGSQCTLTQSVAGWHQD